MLNRLKKMLRGTPTGDVVVVVGGDGHPTEVQVPSLDEVYKANVRNWCCLPLATRELALGHLRQTMQHQWPHVLERWREQSNANEPIGSDDPMFHFGAGMAVRNILRQVVPDHKLPAVKQPMGGMASNWDDYYHGALEALVFNEKPPQTRPTCSLCGKRDEEHPFPRSAIGCSRDDCGDAR